MRTKTIYCLNQSLVVLLFFLSTTIFSQSIVTVTDTDSHGWQKEEQHLGKIHFANGPSKAPLKKGSLEFNAPENGHGRFVRMRNNRYSGTLLSKLTQLSYSTFVQRASSKRDIPFIVLVVDADGNGIEDTHMSFDPRFQNPGDTNGFLTNYGWCKPMHTNDKAIKWQKPIRQKIWQTWDALHGGWYTWTVKDNILDANPPIYSLSSFVAKHPNAQIINDKSGGGVRLQAGGIPMANNFVGNADAFTIGINGKTTVYDFELSIAQEVNRNVSITTAKHDPTIIKVTELNLNGWDKHEQHLGKISFTEGPSKSPLSKGSLQFDAPVNGHARQVRMRNSNYSGILLSSITELSYSTFVQNAGSKRDAPLLVLLVDIDGDGKAVRDGGKDGDIPHITFIPRFQNLEDTTGYPVKFGWYKPKKTNDKEIRWQPPVLQNAWQTWDLLHGGWVNWTVVNNSVDTSPSLFSLSSFIAQHPNARIVNDKVGGGVRIQVGGPDMADNFIGNVDAFTIGINGKTTVYDFEMITDTAISSNLKKVNP